MGFYVNELAALFTGREHYHSVDESEQCVILTHSDIKAGMMLSSALTLDDITSFAVGATEDFNTKSFAF